MVEDIKNKDSNEEYCRNVCPYRFDSEAPMGCLDEYCPLIPENDQYDDYDDDDFFDYDDEW